MKKNRLPWLYRVAATLLIPLQMVTGPVTQALASECANEPSIDNSSLPSIPEAPASIQISQQVPPQAIPKADPGITQAPAISFSEQPTDVEFLTCRVFLEPLVAVGGQSDPIADRALANAIESFAANPSAETTGPLELYLSSYPRSPWRIALLTNLGGIYRRGGYWSKALVAWREVAASLPSLEERKASPLVERATAELAELLARLGRTEELSKLIETLRGSELSGAAAEKLAQAKGSLGLMQTVPEKSFRCGPFAVGRVFAALQPGKPEPLAVHESVCTPNGTSLSQVRGLASTLGVNYQAARRSVGAEILVPSVVHWKEGHFAAVVKQIPAEKFLIEDPTFTDSIAISARALDEEGSGYYLVRSGPLPVGWAPVADEDAAKVWGKGAVPTNGDPTPPCIGFDINCTPCATPTVGLATYSVDPLRVNLRLSDTPLAYDLPRGGSMNVSVHYSHRDVAPSSTPLYSHLGPQWNLNWIAYVIDDPANTATKTYGPGGGTLKYSGYSAGTQEFAPQKLTRVRLKRTSATSYEKYFPDGSRQVFGLADTSVPKRIFLTESFDAAGNKTTFNYDANFRISSVVDPLGQLRARDRKVAIKRSHSRKWWIQSLRICGE